MPLQPEHILNYLENEAEAKYKSDLIDLLMKRIDKLCFEECQIDRIQCTLTPLCARRFLLKLRIKNGLALDDLPKFCYSVHKGVIERDFRNKTVVYRPYDTYLYLIDFLDVFFHGDYRKLNKSISFEKWKDALTIFDDRINNRNENFKYILMNNYMIFKFDDRIHVIYINEKYALVNANRENIISLELLLGLIILYAQIYFPEVSMKLVTSQYVSVSTMVPHDVLVKIKDNPPEDDDSKINKYFWNVFPEDLDALTQFCEEIHLEIDKNENLEIILNIGIESNNYIEGNKRVPLRFRDLRLILNFITRIYNDFYIIWVD
ncbi:MAG: hypothetical protein ACFFA6_06895 [Promethearchaeota archaeon]